MPSEKKVSNRLIGEKSSYLLQHAYNPVNWHPWCDEAFAKARAEDKPVFLSIGYSTCHWCHVMAHESFEDEDVAALLNRYFVSIKVDREERPDVDSVYMRACQTLTGSGGWPLSIFMTPDRLPFFAGTYFPKDDRGRQVGFIGLLRGIAGLWDTRRDDLFNQSRQIIEAMTPGPSSAREVDMSLPERAFSQLEQNFDKTYGGFGVEPKFPTPHNLLFLIKYGACKKSARALEMCRRTLDGMRVGGIFDHVGFGFARYSTDRHWLVPHFEKMLYDNALLCMAYAECFAATGEKRFAQTAEQIIEYLIRDLKSPEGGFYTAEDADSEGREGRFYLFTLAEAAEALGGDAEEFCRYFGISTAGNFDGSNILNTIGVQIPGERTDFADACRRKLLKYRDGRIRPFRDEKILTSQNGLAIAALAMAGRILQREEYTQHAITTARFILERMRGADGRLMAVYYSGPAKQPAFAEDYAYLAWGLIELHQATLADFWLEEAVNLHQILTEDFYDGEQGGFFLSGQNSEAQILRPKEIYDGATPSANAVAVYNAIRLARLAHLSPLEEQARRTLESFMGEIESLPMAHTFSALNILLLDHGSADAFLTAQSMADIREFLVPLRQKYLPFVNVRAVIAPPDELGEYPMINGKPTAYLCRDYSCLAPVSSPDELARLLLSYSPANPGEG